jgi:hypothetical protein
LFCLLDYYVSLSPYLFISLHLTSFLPLFHPLPLPSITSSLFHHLLSLLLGDVNDPRLQALREERDGADEVRTRSAVCYKRVAVASNHQSSALLSLSTCLPLPQLVYFLLISRLLILFLLPFTTLLLPPYPYLSPALISVAPHLTPTQLASSPFIPSSPSLIPFHSLFSFSAPFSPSSCMTFPPLPSFSLFPILLSISLLFRCVVT